MRNLLEEMPESQPHSVSPLTLQPWLLITRNTMKKRKKTLNCMITFLNTQLTSQGQWQHIMTTQSSNCGQKDACLTCSSPSLLPGSLSPTSLFFLMSCQGPGPPRTWWVKGRGVKTPKWDWDRGLQRANDALWHTDLETAVPLDRTVIIWYLPLPCIILDVVHLSALFICLFVLYNNAPSIVLSLNPNLLVLQHLFRWFKSGSSNQIEEVKLSKCWSVSFFIPVWIEWAKKKNWCNMDWESWL